MSQRYWRPWLDTHGCGEGAKPERYALQDPRQLHYLAIAAGNQLIERVSDPSLAWAFHTHERAVDAAREIARIFQSPIDVVKLA